MKILLALLLLLSSTPLLAQTTYSLDLNLASVHTERWARQDLNQQNEGLGATAHFSENWSLSTGFYRNSYSRESAYLLSAWTPIHVSLGSWRVDAGGEAGLVSGYRRAEVPTQPFMAAGLIRIVAPNRWSVNMNVVPNAPNRSSGFIGLQASIPL
jgi:hypothetical protein